MLEYNLGLIRIKINLSNGAYIFDSSGGTGKTRLYRLLEELPSKYDISIASYNDRSKSINYDINWKSSLIMLDRFDLFVSKEICRLIKDVSANSVVLCDLKDNTKFKKYGVDYDFVRIKLINRVSVEVY